MGNENSSHKKGFYTPSRHPATPITPYNEEKQMSIDLDIDINPTPISPDNIAQTESQDTSRDFRPEFRNDISDMLTEIASEIDSQYPTQRKTIALALETDSASASPQPLSPRHKYGHIALDFVPKQNYVHKINERFTYQRQLGCGASCRVLLVHDKDNVDQKYALKEMMISDELNRLLFATEYKILKILAGHQNILGYHDSFIDKNCYYLSTQFCSGGTMLDRILNQGHFNEEQCSEFIKNVLFGIRHMHSHKIVHRDIKCENLVFDKLGKDATVKIIDFGNSEMIKNPKQIDKILIGSLHYLPPELLSSQIRTKEMLYKGDMWAIGVVCYILVSGKVPFYGTNQQETLECIKDGHFEWPLNVKLSDSCKDFISRLLEVDMDKRFDANQALKHEWIAEKGKALNIDFGDDHLNQIQLFQTANKLQKILINSILSEMDKKERKVLLTALRDLDLNGNKTINENDIINYVLMHDKKINEVNQQQNEKNAKKFMSHVRNLSSYGIYSDELAMNLKKPQNKGIKGINGNLKTSTQIKMEDIDIEDILDEIDECDATEIVEDKKTSIDKRISMTVPSTKSHLSASMKSATKSVVRDKFDMVDDDEDEESLDSQDEEEDKFDEEAVEKHKLNFYNFSSAQSDSENDDLDDLPAQPPIASTKISVERFSFLVSKAAKGYDVEDLVDRLKPTNSGNIHLNQIHQYNGPLRSKDSNDRAMQEVISLGMDIKSNSSDMSMVDEDSDNDDEF